MKVLIRTAVSTYLEMDQRGHDRARAKTPSLTMVGLQIQLTFSPLWPISRARPLRGGAWRWLRCRTSWPAPPPKPLHESVSSSTRQRGRRLTLDSEGELEGRGELDDALRLGGRHGQLRSGGGPPCRPSARRNLAEPVAKRVVPQEAIEAFEAGARHEQDVDDECGEKVTNDAAQHNREL